MSQYYRDVLSMDLHLPYIGGFPLELARAVLYQGQCNNSELSRIIWQASTGLSQRQELALKNALLSIALANFALDRYWGGKRIVKPAALADAVRDGLIRAVQADPQVLFFELLIQMLFRVGDIRSIMNLTAGQMEASLGSPKILLILAMISLMERNYAQARSHTQRILTNFPGTRSQLLPLIHMMSDFMLGNFPVSPVDFSTLLTHAGPPPHEQREDFEWVWPQTEMESVKPAVITYCDEKYFNEHGRPFLYSLYETNGNQVKAHFHLFHPDQEFIGQVRILRDRFPELCMNCTSDDIRPPENIKGVYYTGRRFSLLGKLLRHYRSPLFLTDIDVLFRKSLLPLFPDETYDAMIMDDDDNSPAWETVGASSIYVRQTPAGYAFLDKVSRFIEYNFQAGNHIWFLDQIALSAVYIKERQNLRVKREKYLNMFDISQSADSAIWAVTNWKELAADYNQHRSELLAKYTSR